MAIDTAKEQDAELPLVLLHGVGLDSSMWEPLIAEFRAPGVAANHTTDYGCPAGGASIAETRQILPVDLPGHGEQPPLRTEQSLASLAEDVLRRLPPKCHLLGFSLGALIAQQIALSEPDRVDKLIFVSSVCQRTKEESDSVLRRLDLAKSDPAAASTASIQRWFPQGKTSVANETVKELYATLQQHDNESFLHAYEVFAAGDAVLSEDLSKIEANSLAITGELDPGSTPEMARRLAEAVPRCAEVILPGVRHMLPVEAPTELAVLIHDFLH